MNKNDLVIDGMDLVKDFLHQDASDTQEQSEQPK